MSYYTRLHVFRTYGGVNVVLRTLFYGQNVLQMPRNFDQNILCLKLKNNIYKKTISSYNFNRLFYYLLTQLLHEVLS